MAILCVCSLSRTCSGRAEKVREKNTLTHVPVERFGVIGDEPSVHFWQEITEQKKLYTYCLQNALIKNVQIPFKLMVTPSASPTYVLECVGVC